MLKQALINVEETDIRVAMLEDGALVELFVEDLTSKSKVGNIYKGQVEGIVPSLKAVFVNIGSERNAFLHFSDVLPEYELPQRGRPERHPPAGVQNHHKQSEAGEDHNEGEEYIDPLFLPPDEEWEEEDEEADKAHKQPSPRSKPLHVGDEILVQVTKDEISTKGPRITTYISLPGRYLVYMPQVQHKGGISRRIEDQNERRRLRLIMRELKPEQGSLIIRTAGLEQTEEAIRQDIVRLNENWKTIQRRVLHTRAPVLIYNDQDIVGRVVRDNFTDDLDEILIDSRGATRDLIQACQEMTPGLVDRIHLYDSPINIFDTFEVEKQFQKALRRKVWLRSGGAIVIDETEALTAIDINTGKSVGHEDQEQLILKTNLEACRAIARQLRLRDLGGLIVIDFIDMNQRENEKQVMREFKRCLKTDRAKYSVSDFSEFGLVQMTRKRVRMSLANAFFSACPYCEGSGRILSDAHLGKQLKYDLVAALEKDANICEVEIYVHAQLKQYLQTHLRQTLMEVANHYQVSIRVIAAPDYHHERMNIVTKLKSTVDKQGGSDSAPSPRSRRRSQKTLESETASADNTPESQPRPG